MVILGLYYVISLFLPLEVKGTFWGPAKNILIPICFVTGCVFSLMLMEIRYLGLQGKPRICLWTAMIIPSVGNLLMHYYLYLCLFWLGLWTGAACGNANWLFFLFCIYSLFLSFQNSELKLKWFPFWNSIDLLREIGALGLYLVPDRPLISLAYCWWLSFCLGRGSYWSVLPLLVELVDVCFYPLSFGGHSGFFNPCRAYYAPKTLQRVRESISIRYPLCRWLGFL